MVEAKRYSDDELKTILILNSDDPMYGTRIIKDRDIEDYEGLLGTHIRETAVASILEKGKFTWYDMCCGDFRAAYGTVEHVKQRLGADAVSCLSIAGVDLNSYPKKITETVRLVEGNVLSYPLPPDTDLITSLRGLRYVEQYLHAGKDALEHWYNSLPVGGQIIFDTDDLKWQSERWIYLKERLKDSINFRSTSIPTNAGRWRNGEQAYVCQIIKNDTSPLVIPV